MIGTFDGYIADEIQMILRALKTILIKEIKRIWIYCILYMGDHNVNLQNFYSLIYYIY